MRLAIGMLTLAPLLPAVPGALPPLPRAISGQCAGTSHGVLLVIGGSYFPTPYFEGGKKTWVDTIYALEKGSWRTFHAPRAIGYAACVTIGDDVIVAGGGDSEQSFRSAFRLTWHDGQPRTFPLPDLPEPIANAAAVAVGRKMYVAGGQSSPAAAAASRALWMLDLDRVEQGWKKLEDCPGAGRILPVFGTVAGELYLASGAALTGPGQRRYLVDAWRYRPGSGWTRLRDVARAVVAGPALSRPGGIYVFGGDDGANATRIQELKDRHPGFRREIQVWHPDRDEWQRVAEYPEGLVTTSVVAWEDRAVIAGGEDRPGHRSAAVFSIPLTRLP